VLIAYKHCLSPIPRLERQPRTDRYGGLAEPRALAIEVVEAIVAEIRADRTGIRLSPGFTGMGLGHGDEALRRWFGQALSTRKWEDYCRCGPRKRSNHPITRVR
jgi:2,4-dienoyl-CoA reductase-like NADH-dependent reductase (Old Yellow Enzyme family)